MGSKVEVTFSLQEIRKLRRELWISLHSYEQVLYNSA